MADDLSVVSSQPLPDLAVVDSQPLPSANTGFWSHVGQSIRSMAPDEIPSFTDVLKAAGESTMGPAAKALEALHGAATEYAAARQRGHGVPYSAAAGASTAVGVSPERMEQAASQGDTAGVLGEAAVPTAIAVAPFGVEGAGRIAAPVVRPALEATGRALAPAKPQLLEAAQAIMHPTEIPGRILKAAVDTIPDTPEVIAAKQRAIEEQQGADTLKAIKMQDIEARRVARQTSQQQRQQQSQSPTSTSTQSPSPIVQSSSPSVASEGRPATWTNESVLARASQGDMTAIQQARLRSLPLPENAGLVGNKGATIEPTVGTRKGDIVHFDSEGNPIGPTPPKLAGGPADFKKLTLTNPEDQSDIGMGTDHIIRDPNGNRIGSINIEPPKDGGVAHVHWLSGDDQGTLGSYGRPSVENAIKEQYPDTKKVTYARRRLAKGADAATTTPREMSFRTGTSSGSQE
jgi:hypothetical protein